MSVFKTPMFASLSIRARFVSGARKLPWLTVVLVSCLWSHLAYGSALSDLATSLQSGTWAPLTTTGFNNGDVMRPPAGGSILEFTDEAAWNPRNNTVMALGASHAGGGDPGQHSRFLKYTESANAWTELTKPFPAFDSGAAHEYHHATLVPATGDFYHRQYYSRNVMKFAHATQTWSQCTPLGTSNVQVGGALEYFPDRNSLVYLDGDWGVWELSLASGNCLGTWVQRASTNAGTFQPKLTGLFSYHNQSRYSSRCTCIIMGGGNGSRKLYRYNANDTFAAITDAPVEISVPRAGAGAIFTVDPVNGYILVWSFANAATTMYQYDPLANSWTTISRTSPIFPGPEGGVTETIAVPISNYGVIMFVQAGSSSGGRVYLYRHAAGSRSTPPPSDTAAPSIPSGVSAIAASSSQINISWVASTDNVAVQGYKIYRGGVEIDTSTTTSYSDSSASSSTTYSYTVAAYDAAGNTSGQSAPSSATTQSAVSTPPPSESSDFQTRCSQPGVIKCVAFDSTAEITGDWGKNPQGSLRGSSGGPVIDTSIKASGNGSMQFTIPAGQVGGAAGSFFSNFSNDLSQQFGGNTEFYLQWRMRIDNNFYSATQGRVGMKHAITGTGSRPGLPVSSCTDLEIVIQNNGARGFPAMYHSCSGNPINYSPFQERFGSYDFKLQNARPSPYCLYSQKAPASTAFPPLGNCFAYFPNEWMTFQQHVKLGPKQQKADGYWYFVGSHIDLWIAREGEPSQQIFNWGPYDLEASAIKGSGGGTDDQRYGQIWLLPYSGSDIYPNGGITWYDELIISTVKIPDPNSVATPRVQPPTAPSDLTLK
jgi:Fibronectin type III domain